MVANGIVDLLGDADAPRFRQRVDARGDVHAVAEHFVAREQHIAHVNPDPKPQLRFVVQRLVDCARAGDRLDGAVEARQRPVTDLFDQRAVELRKELPQKLPAARENTDCRLLIAPHERGVASYVGEHDRGESSGFGRHLTSPSSSDGIFQRTHVGGLAVGHWAR